MSQKRFSSRAPTQVSETRQTKKLKILQYVRKLNQLSNAPKKPQPLKRQENQTNRSIKTACDFLNYRRNQKYFRTLGYNVKTCRKRNPKTTELSEHSFCFCDFTEAVAFNFLPNVTPS
jgi:hypothetical protein